MPGFHCMCMYTLIFSQSPKMTSKILTSLASEWCTTQKLSPDPIFLHQRAAFHRVHSQDMTVHPSESRDSSPSGQSGDGMKTHWPSERVCQCLNVLMILIQAGKHFVLSFMGVFSMIVGLQSALTDNQRWPDWGSKTSGLGSESPLTGTRSQSTTRLYRHNSRDMIENLCTL